jgi:hypothetical protein
LQFQAQVLPLPLIQGKPLVQGWVRIIQPYPYTYSTYAKSRWIGRTVLDVYHTEFGSYPEVRVVTLLPSTVKNAHQQDFFGCCVFIDCDIAYIIQPTN